MESPDKRSPEMRRVSESELDSFISSYPRKLAYSEYRDFDLWQDPALGRFPKNIVARRTREPEFFCEVSVP